MGLYDKIFKPKKLVLANGKVVEEKCSRKGYWFFHDNACDENPVFL